MDQFIEKLYKKYNHQIIEDAGSVTSKEFNSFAAFTKKQLKASAEARGFRLYSFNKGHYDISGFFEKDGKFIYFSYSEPRYSAIDFDRSDDVYMGFLYRTTENEKDYRGGQNHFTSLPDFMDAVERLFAA